jgi:threonine dehydrogenase-like Zn-dependent dehydrogenase
VRALQIDRAPLRFASARLASTLRGSGRGAEVGALRLGDVDPPARPGPAWGLIRPVLAGICGSDLATVDGASSRYFEPLVSFPFVPGHEVVGTVEVAPDGSDLAAGSRVVVEPVLGCRPREITPPCPACAVGDTGACQHVAFGHLAPGLQIGYCADTGGGWSAAGLVAHESQLHLVPDTLSDEDAVLVEPTACAVHAALASGAGPGSTVAVLGAGTLGLTTVAALRHFRNPARLLVGARYPHQRRLAAELGADQAIDPDQLPAAVRRATGSLRLAGQLTAGADVVVDCVGTGASLAAAVAMTRPRGRVVLVGMPGRVTVDLAPLWHRQVSVAGAYAYGLEAPSDGEPARRTFPLALELVAAARLGRLVSARYPLDRYAEALAHAGAAGRRGAVKIVFEPGLRSPRPDSGDRRPVRRPLPTVGPTRKGPGA